MVDPTSYFSAAPQTATVRSGKLEITPRIIDFGDRVIQLSQVSSVLIDFIFPWRALALLCGVIAIGGVVGGLSNSGRYGNDSAAMFGFVVAVVVGLIALVAWNRKQEFLLITTSDGRRLQIDAKRKLLDEILLKIRDAMLFEPGRDIRYTVNLNAEKIEIGSIFDMRTASVVNSPGASAVAGDIGAAAPSARPDPGRFNGAGTNGAGYNGAGRNGADFGSDRNRGGAGAPADPPSYTYGFGGRQDPVNITRSASVTGSPGGIAVAGDAHGARFETTIEMMALGEIRDLIALIESREVAHKADLVALLDGVSQQLAAGPSRRREAETSWRSFADYALKYLGHLDGVLAAVERIGRMLG